MTSYLGGSGSASGVSGSYVAAQGGASAASQRATALKNSAKRLGKFLAGAAQGFEEALQERGLGDVIGQSFDVIISALVDWIAGPGDSHEDIVSRVVVSEILVDLYEEAEFDSGLWDTISRDRITEEVLQISLRKLVEKWIVEDVWRRGGDRAEMRNLSSQELRAKQAEFEDYVSQELIFSFGEHGAINLVTADWESEEVRSIIDDVVLTSLAILGAAG
jgi:hypothetical protein